MFDKLKVFDSFIYTLTIWAVTVMIVMFIMKVIATGS